MIYDMTRLFSRRFISWHNARHNTSRQALSVLLLVAFIADLSCYARSAACLLILCYNGTFPFPSIPFFCLHRPTIGAQARRTLESFRKIKKSFRQIAAHFPGFSDRML